MELAKAEPAPIAPPLRILLIDDEPTVREALADTLVEDGHAVVQAPSGPEALARLGEGTPVDLVLTDLGMPEMTGWDVARAVRQRWPGLPIGLVTGWAVALEMSDEERRGVDSSSPSRTRSRPAFRPRSRPACLRWGAERAPHTPTLRAPAQPWRFASVVVMYGLERAPTPHAPGPGAAVALRERRSHVRARRALSLAPRSAPRRSRGASRAL